MRPSRANHTRSASAAHPQPLHRRLEILILEKTCIQISSIMAGGGRSAPRRPNRRQIPGLLFLGKHLQQISSTIIRLGRRYDVPETPAPPGDF
jgi:hypothetical protein